MLSIAITILKCQDRYLFLKRRNPPYENLWSLIGGKIALGEHVREAAIREIKEETGARDIRRFEHRGFVSERLIDTEENLLSHFMIFVGHALIDDFIEDHREGDLSLFTLDDIDAAASKFLPSDFEMFRRFKLPSGGPQMHEAELLYDGNNYSLNYYREIGNEY